MLGIESRQSRITRLAHAVASTVVASLAITSACVSAQDARPTHSSPALQLAGMRLADLERAFWICDYTATVHGARGDQVTACTAVYDELKARKFDGDYDELLAWWQQNKPSAHARLSLDDRTR